MAAINIDRIMVTTWVKPGCERVNEFIMKRSGLMLHDYRFTHIAHSIAIDALKTENFDLYKLYITSTDQKEHSVEKFQALEREFDIGKMAPIRLVPQFNHLVVLDGVHRLALLVHKKLITTHIPASWVTIEYTPQHITDVDKLLIGTTGLTHSNGWSNNRCKHGYHSLSIYNLQFKGQRDPVMRLENMRRVYDFQNKKVLDLGTNSGGMIHHLFEAKECLGLDFDATCVEAASKISGILGIHTSNKFVQHNLENPVQEFLTSFTPDVIFLLSLGSWVRNWPILYASVISYMKAHKSAVFLELNNAVEGAAQINLFESQGCKLVLVSDTSPDDSTGNHGRSLYYITSE